MHHAFQIFDIDSGMVASVSGENLVQLPPALRQVPPLVLCLAVQNDAVDGHSCDYLKQDSIVVCKIGVEESLICVEGAYPPVLIGAVQSDENATKELSQLPTSRCTCRTFRHHSSSLSPANGGLLKMESEVMDAERKISSGVNDRPESQKFPFVPYMASPLPCHRVVRVSRVIGNNLYAVRDTTLLADLYGCSVGFSCSLEICCYLRALARHFDPMRGTCMAYLIDYDQSVECDTSALFEIADQVRIAQHFLFLLLFYIVPGIALLFDVQRSMPPEVREIPTAAFFFSVVGSAYGERNGAVDQLNQDDQYNICILTEQNGSYAGTVSMPAVGDGGSTRRQLVEERKLEEQRRMQAEEEQTNREQIRRMEAELKQKAESLRRERELFEISNNLRRKRTQELSLVTMQLQVANISRKMDTIATCGFSSGAVGGLGGYGMFGSAAATLSNAIMQQRWQQTTNHTVNTVAAQSTVINQAMVNMQQMLVLLCSSYARRNGFSRGMNEYGDSWRQAERRPRWTRKERDMRATGNFDADRNSSNKRYNRRDVGSRYPQRGSVCTSCQQGGHFAGSCPSNRGAGDRVDPFDPFNKNSPLSSRVDQKVEKEIFYVSRPRDKDGNLLYTSDESSEDETKVDGHSGSEQDTPVEQHEASKNPPSNEPTSETVLSLAADEEIAPAIIFSAGHIIQALSYEVKFACFDHICLQPYFDYVSVEDGQEYTVKRSDEDHANTRWPLFFVHIQEEQMLDFLEQHLDSLQPHSNLSDEQVALGTLCVSYCMAFEANFRAVITNINGNEVEVLYVDYGNYETVQRDQLKSIDDQPEETRLHPAMAIPCILSGLDDGYMNGGGDLEEEDVKGMQADVSCDRDQFRLRFLGRRADGVRVVEVVREMISR
ncbi:unnamed protein product [Toxocara canis]|uniref:Tudor domain-containing protein n=1 Tax=Toxocara canis TaxID=6265 RepID=A0A183UM60_TOXCA|nr:unnamed protein product [Toxocara canis]